LIWNEEGKTVNQERARREKKKTQGKAASKESVTEMEKDTESSEFLHLHRFFFVQQIQTLIKKT